MAEGRARSGPGQRLGLKTRLVLVALALALALVMGLAGWLRPDPRGLGTHTQLGLGPCTFLATTGRPCPSCGMTTAFAWMMHGRPDRAWSANPAGSLLAPTCLALIPWLLVGALRGRPWGSKTVDGPLIVVVVATVALGLATWIVRLLNGRV